MKVGLLTYHFSDNYGALMQAYGLRQWFLDRGISAEFVNYEPPYVEEGGPLDRPWKPALWRKNATILYMKLSHVQRQLFGNRAQRAAFADFRAEHLGIKGARLRDAASISPGIGGFDMLVCGSDQIWNPSIQRGLDPVYFLDIPGAEKARKVAYAPSFGRSSIEAMHMPELARLVQGLDAVSVRETSGLSILQQAGIEGGQAHVVPDPTVLLGAFPKLLNQPLVPDDSIFCYALRSDAVIRDVATAAQTHLGGRIIGPRNTRQRWADIGEGVIPGPVEWLQMLARARRVVSNSFHGVALSLVLNRPFIAVALPGKRAGMNARVLNLLELTGLKERLVETADPATIRRLADTPVDWSMVNDRLAHLRADAEAYLEAEIARLRAQTV